VFTEPLSSEINAMRTNIVIDDALLNAALQATGLPTKKAVVEEALRTLVRLKAQEQVRELRGRLQWEGDLDALRTDRADGASALDGSAATHVDR
jgi:Arc/MetJ family transcription regulator